MRRRKSHRDRRARWKKGARLSKLRPEIYSDPELRALAARLRLALDGLDHPEASKWLREIGLEPPPSRRAG
jgi:hypothetical protein